MRIKMLQSGAILSLLMAMGSAAGFAADGKAIYDAKCASCHAKEGQGNPAMAKVFHVDAAALSVVGEETAKKKDDELAAITEKGKGKMPAYKDKLTADDIKAVVAYVRQLGAPKK